MSAKTRRLKNRLRIEEERRRSVNHKVVDLLRREISVADAEKKLRLQWRELNEEKERIKRSVALRMRVDRQFDRPIGNVWALNIVFYPHEFKLAFHHSRSVIDEFQDASYFAEMKGREAGKQIADVILRCITGELKEFEKAS